MVERARYINLQLPKDLGDNIDDFLERQDFGFRSRAEVVAHAVREFLWQHQPRKDPGLRLPRRDDD